MTLQIHRAERTDRLADALGDLLATPLADPFAEEVVVVPARGVERWLTQRLSHRLGVGERGGDGVCAGVAFLNPHSLVAMLLGKERGAGGSWDPWDPDRMVWPLLEVVDEAMGEPWCATLAAHLGHGVPGEEGDLRRNRRYSVARRLAGLFASYAVQRPRLVTDWREGRDTDGAGGTLEADLGWQPELWRRLVERVGEPPPDLRHARTLERLREGDGETAGGLHLPPRLSLFGHTRLPVTEVELLEALGERREVHLWLPQPSAVLWDELRPTAAAGPVPRAEDRSAEHVRHPLLDTLGRDARELQRALGRVGEGVSTGSTGGDVSTESSLLGWLQHDLRANAEPDAATRAARPLAADDHTVQVHACHGATRQVDVLREVLTGLLADDPTLEPRDVLVMCPDIETYAPLVQAGFGMADVAEESVGRSAGTGHPAHRLRVRLADRALTSTNPLLAVAGSLVELAGGRVTATEVLDLASAPPVRRRFGLGDDDLDQLASWVADAGIRWGLDASHRGGYGLSLAENTWRTGLDRILLGATMAEDQHRVLRGPVAATLPVDDVSSTDIDLAGRFGELLDRLHAFVDAATAARTVADWTRALSEGVDGLTALAPRDTWQAAQLERELARIGEGAGGGSATPLRLADVRHLLAQRLGGRPTRANFRTGTLTVCTMVPMRSVPHRVVCLVGLDDGVFPRNTSVDGDDVLARAPMTGERDARSEDRQLLLDAVLAAREHLVLTYTGANEHTGAERPPAVPLGELLDSLDRTAAGPVRDQVLVHHPLQPFDERNLTPGALTGTGPFSFDAAALAGAEAARGPRTPAAALVPGPLPAREPADLALADLHAFLAHPVRAFLRARLDVSAPLEAEETRDDIPLGLDALEKWAVGDRLLADVLSGADAEASMLAEQLRGLLPPAALGRRTLGEVCELLQPILHGAMPLRQGTPRRIDVDVDLGEGRRLTGTVGPVFGHRLVSVTYSKLAAKHRLASWVNLLALAAARPDEHWTAHAVGKGTTRSGARHALTGPLDHRALEWLRELVDLHDRGMREPLPLPVNTACAYAEEAHKAARGGSADRHPVAEARKQWTTDRFGPVPGEQDDPAHVQAFGEAAPVEVLLTEPGPDECWNRERHRLGQYAVRLWGPLLDGAEQEGPL